MNRTIPEWLQPLKNEWLSASKLSKIFHKESGGSFLSWFNGVKVRCRKVSIPCKSGASDVSTHYLVKHVWSMAQAHNVMLLPTPASDPAKFIETLQKENEHLRSAADSALRLLNIERNAHQKTRLQVDDLLPKNSVTALLVKAHEPRPIAGVYFLVCDDEIVYVGQSKNVLSRMSGHADKRFNTVKMIPVGEDRLLSTERMMIEILRPRYNKMHNGGVEYKPSTEAAKA